MKTSKNKVWITDNTPSIKMLTSCMRSGAATQEVGISVNINKADNAINLAIFDNVTGKNVGAHKSMSIDLEASNILCLIDILYESLGYLEDGKIIEHGKLYEKSEE